MGKNNCSTDKPVYCITAVKPDRIGMKKLLEEERPKEMSLHEKDILCMMFGESCKLDYPLKPLKMAYGKPEQVYEIPEEDKEKVLNDLWPFSDRPAMDETLYDIHEDALFVFKDAQVIRCRGRNMIVSPYFKKTGGMLVDFVRQEQKDERFHASEVRKQ